MDSIYFFEREKLPIFTDMKIITKLLKTDQFFKHNKSEISRFFTKCQDRESRAIYIKDTYNDEFTVFTDENGIVYGYKTYIEGLLIWLGNFMTRSAEVFYTWDEVQNIYSDLINDKDFLDKTVPNEQEFEQISFFDLVT